MKTRLTIMLVIAVLLTASLSTPTATCATCTKQDQIACVNEGLDALNKCFQIYGSWVGMIVCPEKYDQAEMTCLLIKGCPQVPYQW